MLMQRLITIVPMAALLSAQQQPAKVEFDVASIKPNKSDSNSSSMNDSDGYWRCVNTSVKSIFLNAFDVLPEQIVNAPAWVDSERFDIQARYEKDASLSGMDSALQMKARLRALLESRFDFKMHRETREWQAYALVPGKKGPKLTPTARKEGGSSTRTNNGHMEAQGTTMDNLARNLALRLGRPVVNETGLDGRFDFTLDFESESKQVRIADKDSPIAGVEDPKPSLFTALQDQLGLRLEARKAQVEMLVIDRIARPSDN